MIAAGLALMAGTAVAAADPVAFDIQCVIAAQTAIQSPDLKPELKMMLMSAVTYFSGRLDAELSAADLEARLLVESKRLEGQQIAPMLQQCGDYMEARGKVWTDIGERMKAREKASHSS
jgi:hypothetical protein